MSHIKEIKKTADGSDTLISRQFNQPYHSLSGAVAESRYVYFQTSGLLDALTAGEDLGILEIGFGTGMNLILMLDYIKQKDSNSTVDFYSVEAYPIDPETAASVRFGNHIDNSTYSNLLSEIFSGLTSEWNTIEISEKVTLNLFIGTFEQMELFNPKPIDYVLHDPFSPDSNPAGWTSDLFTKIASSASNDSMLTTYSAATSARAAMAVAGWNIARAPGALGKREMTVASKNPNRLSHLKRVNEKLLIERSEAGDFT